jgi:hypothetical protein
MPTKFASGKRAIAICDRCGFEYPLKKLKELTIKTKSVNLLVCPECWEPDQPQNQLGMYPVNDPQALRNPRPDNSYSQSRDIQWGWNPVGLDNALGLVGVTNNLVATGEVGTVTIVTT